MLLGSLRGSGSMCEMQARIVLISLTHSFCKVHQVYLEINWQKLNCFDKSIPFNNLIALALSQSECVSTLSLRRDMECEQVKPILPVFFFFQKQRLPPTPPPKLPPLSLLLLLLLLLLPLLLIIQLLILLLCLVQLPLLCQALLHTSLTRRCFLLL